MGRRQVNFDLDDRAWLTLEQMAKSHGYSASGYAKMLFHAAFASRAGKQRDPDIDAQIGAAVVLHGAKLDSAAIARAVQLSESTVVRIIDAWRRERLAA